VSVSTRKKILSFLEKSKDKAFIRKEFSSFGSGRQVARVLSELVAEGSLVRAGQSIWVKSIKYPSLLRRDFGKIVTIAQLDAIGTGLAALTKMGRKVSHAQLKLDQLEGRSTQVPIGVKIRILDGGRKCKIVVNGQRLDYEEDRLRS